MAKKGYNVKDHPRRYAALVAAPCGIPVIIAYETFKIARVYVRKVKAAKIKRRRKESRLKIIVSD